MIRALLGGVPDRDLDPRLLAVIRGGERDLSAFRAPRAYQTFLPAPVWGEVLADAAGVRLDDADEEGGDSIHTDSRRRKASRRSNDQSQRGDPLLLHRFETIFSLNEMVNVNRSVDDDDEAGARQAADDLPELTIGAHQKRASTRLKLDLDLAPAEAEAERSRPSSPTLSGTGNCRSTARAIAASSPDAPRRKARIGRRTERCSGGSGRCVASSRPFGPSARSSMANRMGTTSTSRPSYEM